MKKSKILVSVLMSVYNGEKYLREAVKSILKQSFKDFEFLIVDDCSTDRTLGTLQSFKDSRIRIIRNKKKIGLTKSLNRGLKLAKGKYIARMDVDDISLTERLERQVNFLERHPRVGVLGTQLEIIDERGKKIGLYKLPCSHDMLVWKLLFGRSFAHPSIMMKRNLINNVKGYNYSFSVSQDYELWTRLASHTQFANLAEFLLKYRVHKQAICQTQNKLQKINVLKARQKLISTILDKKINLKSIKRLHSSQTFEHILTNKQIEQIVGLILECYKKMREKNYFKKQNLGEIHSDMIRRIIRASRCLAFPFFPKLFWQFVRFGGYLKQKIIKN